MAHFAKISEENIVLQVLTLNDSDMLDSNNVENESIGQEYLEKHNNWPKHLWIQTSYNTVNNQHKFNGIPLRGNFAGIGYTWDEQNQIFWPPKPYPSWSKNIQIGTWESPIGPRPQETQEMIDNKQYYIWNENNISWDIYPISVQI